MLPVHSHAGLDGVIVFINFHCIPTILGRWQAKKNGSQLDELLIAEVLDPLFVEDKINVGS